MAYVLSRDILNRLDPNHLEEWFLGNGLGGFSSGSVINASFRKQHGYLVAAKKAPINRFLILTKTEETVEIGGTGYDLSSQKYDDHFQRGDKYLDSFVLDEAVTFRYLVKGIRIEKTIAPHYGHNTVAVAYKIKTGSQAAKMAVTPLFNHRPHSDISSGETLSFAVKLELGRLTLEPPSDPTTLISFFAPQGDFLPLPQPVVDRYFYDFDASTGDPRTDAHFRPYSLMIDLPAQTETSFGVVCTTETETPPSAEKIIAEYRFRAKDLIKKAGFDDPFLAHLVLAADQFVCHRASTGKSTILAGLPWFTDWGRDTMIAFEGLMLVTKRFEEAKGILQSFARYEKNGLIPNMFPDDGQEPYYNTVDASLWYIHAVDRYLEHTHDDAFVKTYLFPCMKSIIHHYRKGTDFGIKMEMDGLIRAGFGLDQVTWMDVRINGEVVTPRHGKPVEINALWYNALCIMAKLAKRYHYNLFRYAFLAGRTRISFNRRFWNRDTLCLFDVVDQNDPSIRPNQLFALGLPYSPLSKARAKMVMETVTNDLYDTFGIRTLSPSDPRFKPVYAGNVDSRDHAYHMGTAWPFLMGSYVASCLKINEYSDEAKRRAKGLLLNFVTAMNHGCLNGIAEVYDGFHGMVPKGCCSQAWSVGEILRVYAINRLDEVGKEGK